MRHRPAELPHEFKTPAIQYLVASTRASASEGSDLCKRFTSTRPKLAVFLLLEYLTHSIQAHRSFKSRVQFSGCSAFGSESRVDFAYRLRTPAMPPAEQKDNTDNTL